MKVRLIDERSRAEINFIGPLDRYAEIHASLPALKKELSRKWQVASVKLRIRNPVYVPSEAEIHLIVEFVKDVAAVAGVTIQTWKFLKKRLPWLKKPKRKTKERVKAHTSPRPKQRRRV
jgi:hypothetical protein